MPSQLHEGLTDLFRSRPALAVEVLTNALGVALPEYESVRADPADLTDLRPTEYRADAVVVLRRDETPVHAVIVEIQLRRDERKQWSWPVYVATLRARLECAVELLVVCPHSGTARWCATPIPLGGSGSQVVPLVLGPDLVPVVPASDGSVHRPELAVLSAIAHGRGAEQRVVLPALRDALEDVETENRKLYIGLVHAALPEAARHYLEAIMSTSTDQKLTSFERGLMMMTQAQTILTILEARSVAISDAQRTLIDHCRKRRQLDEWTRRAATATTAEDLFD